MSSTKWDHGNIKHRLHYVMPLVKAYPQNSKFQKVRKLHLFHSTPNINICIFFWHVEYDRTEQLPAFCKAFVFFNRKSVKYLFLFKLVWPHAPWQTTHRHLSTDSRLTVPKCVQGDLGIIKHNKNGRCVMTKYHLQKALWNMICSVAMNLRFHMKRNFWELKFTLRPCSFLWIPF